MSYYVGDIVRLRNKFFEAYNSGEYTDAIKYGSDIIKLYENNNDIMNLAYANDLNNMAIVYGDLMAHEKSIKLYKQAAEIKNKVLGEGSLSYADTLGNLAVSLSLDGRYADALPLHKKVLKIRESHLDMNHKDCITSLFNLASAYEDLKKHDRALSCFEAALKRADNCKDIQKKDYADILCGYARVLAKKGRYKKSISSFCKTVEILKTEEGEGNFYYLSTLLEAAHVCEKAKLYDQAIVYFKRAIESRKNIFEKTHLDYITSLNFLAQAFIKKGDFDRAIETHSEVRSLLRQLVGEEHQFYADCMNNLGVDYLKKGDYENAMKYLEETLVLKEKIGGRKHLSYTITLESMGHVYKGLKDFEEAFEKYSEARIIRKQISGEENLLYIESYMNIGKLFLDENRPEKAKEYFEEAKRLRKNLEKYEDMGMVINLQYLAHTSDILGDGDEALDFLEESLSIRKAVYERNHPRYARGLYHVGVMEVKWGKLESAVNNLEFALEIQLDTLGEISPDYKDTAKELVKARSMLCRHYFEAGLYESSVEQFEKGLEIFRGKCLKSRNEYILKNIYTYAKGGKLKEAEELLKETIKNIITYLGSENLEYADCLKAKGKLEIAKGEFQEGEKFFKSALETEEKIIGNRSRSLEEIHVFLGESYFLRGETDKAIFNYNLAIKNEKSEFFSRALSGMGVCFLEKKEYQDAYDYFQKALKIMEKNKKTENMDFAMITKCLFVIYEKEKNYEKAAENLEKNILARRAMNLVSDKSFCDDLISLGILNKKIGKKERASENLSEAASIINKKEGDTKRFADIIIKTAKINIERKKFDIAEILYTKAAEIYAKIYEVNSDEYGNIIYDMAKMYVKAKENDKAYECFIILKEISRKNDKSKFNDSKYFKLWKENR